jgi:hypothetical protein
MRKRTKRKHYIKAVPCLLLDHIMPDAKIALYQALDAFKNGWAQPFHFDTMLDARDMLLLGAVAKEQEDIAEAARSFTIPLSNIKDSWDGEKFYVNDEEVEALKMLLEMYDDFWVGQTGFLFQEAFLTLKEYRKKHFEKEHTQ